MPNLELGLPNWKLPEEIIRRLGKSAGKQRTIFEKNQLLLVLHELPTKDNRDRKNIFYWRKDDGKWEATSGGSGLFALESLVDQYINKEEQLDKLYDSAQSAQDYFEILEELVALKRSCQNMYSTLQSARELVGEELVDIRNKAYHAQRNFELLYADCQNALDYAVAKRSEEQSLLQEQALLAGHKLNAIMALFLPITAMASVIGMNVPKSLEAYSGMIHLATIFSGVIFGFLMRGWVMKRKTEDS